jgi:carbon monoxide dehydrogenase subunit G
MALHTSGHITVAVPRAEAFAFVQDPERLATCIPGCSDLRELEPARYAAVLTGRVAFMTVRFNVTIEILNVDPPQAIDARISGDAIGLVGHVAATAAVRLTAEGDEQTRLSYSMDIALTGKLGGIGQTVFQATSVRLAREFGDNLKRAIEGQRTGTAA